MWLTYSNKNIRSVWHGFYALILFLTISFFVFCGFYLLANFKSGNGMRYFGIVPIFVASGFIFGAFVAILACITSAIFKSLWTSYLSFGLIYLAIAFATLVGTTWFEETLMQSYNPERIVSYQSIYYQISRKGIFGIAIVCVGAFPAAVALAYANLATARKFVNITK